MLVDVTAEVIANTRLSSAYNVLALRAPAIAVAAAPGQFVMVKAAASHDPLLRRPFSVFEVLRDRRGTEVGISLLNKRIGPSTELLYAAQPGQSVACLGPLGHPFTIVDPPTEAWMIAGGVGLAPFAMLAETLRARGVRTTLFYGARSAAELFYLDFFRELGVSLVLTTEDGSMGETGRIVAPLDRHLAARDPSRAGHALRLRAGTDAGGDRESCHPLRPALSGVGRTRHGMRNGRLLQLRCADAQAAMAGFITCGPVSPGPCCRRDQILWD